MSAFLIQAIESMTSTVKYHVKVADPEMAKYKYASIPAISAYNNIKFEKEGIRVWKYHNIGTGRKKIFLLLNITKL